MRNNFTGGGAQQRPSPGTRVTGTSNTRVSPGVAARNSNFRPSPGRGGISNLGGPVNLQRKPTGVKILPGQTNFLERNRQRLEAMQQRSRERAAQKENNNSGTRRPSYERRPGHSQSRVAAGSNDSRKAAVPRVPLYQRNTGATTGAGTTGGNSGTRQPGVSSTYQRSKERIAARQA